MANIGSNVMDFHGACARLYASAVSEAQRRAKVTAEARARSQQGEWGMTQAETAAEQGRRRDFSGGVVKPMADELEKHATQFGVCGCVVR